MALKGTTQSRRRLGNLCCFLQSRGKEPYSRWRKKKNRRGPYGLCERRPRAFLIGWGMLGSLDGSIWLQEDSLCPLVMRVAHGTEMSYICRTLMQIIWACESKDLSSLMALMQLRKWKMFLNSTINCQILWGKNNKFSTNYIWANSLPNLSPWWE